MVDSRGEAYFATDLDGNFVEPDLSETVATNTLNRYAVLLSRLSKSEVN